MFDPANAEAFWLDVTNAALGLVCLVCLLIIAWAAGRDMMAAYRRRSIRLVESDPHEFTLAELGTVMADGGEPLERDEESHEQSSNKRRSEK